MPVMLPPTEVGSCRAPLDLDAACRPPFDSCSRLPSPLCGCAVELLTSPILLFARHVAYAYGKMAYAIGLVEYAMGLVEYAICFSRHIPSVSDGICQAVGRPGMSRNIAKRGRVGSVSSRA